MLANFTSTAWALDKTQTGFYWPIGESDFDSAYGSWLERDSRNGGRYFDGLYHIGVDMMTRTVNGIDSEVYAISDGEVVYKHCKDSSWGPGNCGVFIRHKLIDGNTFIALYGHLRTSLIVGSKVYAGKLIGRTGPYSGGIHLHFGIVPENSVPGTNVSQGIGWGRMGNQHWNESWPNKTNHFVDPVHFLNTHHPNNYLSPNNHINYFATWQMCGAKQCDVNNQVFSNGDIVGWYPKGNCMTANYWFEIKKIDGHYKVGRKLTKYDVCICR